MTYSKLRGGRILRNTRISKHVDGTGKTYAYALWLWGAEVVNVWMEWHELQGERVRISTGGRPTETTNHRINSALRAAGYPLFARKMGMNETSRIDIETLPVDQGEIIVAHGVTSGQAVYTLVGTRDLLRIDRDKEGRYEVWQP